MFLATALVFLPAAWAWGLEAPASSRPGESAKIRVAIYCDQGGLKSAAQIEKCLKVQPERFRWKRVTAEEIRQGALRNYDVVVQGGGSGSKQAKTLDRAGCDALRKFVENGGGYLGICAGAYLATADYDWSLHILNRPVLSAAFFELLAASTRARIIPSDAGLGCRGLFQRRVVAARHDGRAGHAAPSDLLDLFVAPPQFFEVASVPLLPA
jgi:putative intracellular protease/amidase